MRLLRWSSLNWTFAAEGARLETTEGGWEGGREGRREGLCRAFMSDVTTDKRKRWHRGVGERVQRRVEGSRRAAGQCQDDVPHSFHPSFYLSSSAAEGSTMKGQKVPPSPFDLRRRRRRSQRHNTDALTQ